MSTLTLSFFSVKGGTGRSLALANIAYQLASQGKKVGCIDLDVEAPGLCNIFGIKQDDIKISVADLLLEPEELTTVNAIIDIGKEIELENEHLWFIPAKLESFETIKKLEKQKVWTDKGLNRFSLGVLEPFKGIKDLEFLLIDARSGMSKEALMALTLSEQSVVFSRLDSQSRSATEHFIKLMKEFPLSKMLPILVVSSIPTGNAKIHLKEGVEILVSKRAREILAEFKEDIEEHRIYLSGIIIHDEYLMLDPELVVKTRPNKIISSNFKHLANTIIKIKEMEG